MADRDHEVNVQDQAKNDLASLFGDLEESLDDMFGSSNDIDLSAELDMKVQNVDLFGNSDKIDNLAENFDFGDSQNPKFDLELDDDEPKAEIAAIDDEEDGLNAIVVDDEDMDLAVGGSEVASHVDDRYSDNTRDMPCIKSDDVTFQNADDGDEDDPDATRARIRSIPIIHACAEKTQSETPNKVLEAIHEADRDIEEVATGERTMEVSVADLEKLAFLAQAQEQEQEDDEESAKNFGKPRSNEDIAAAVRDALNTNIGKRLQKDEAGEDINEALKEDEDDSISTSGVTMSVDFDDVLKNLRATEEAEAQAKKDAEAAAGSEDEAVEADDGDVESDEDTHQIDDEEGVQLSERAKMGNVMPENEVQLIEHEVLPDTYYEEAECVAVQDPVEHDRVVKRNFITSIICLIVIGLIGVIALLLYEIHNRQAESFTVAQKYAFDVSGLNWSQFASSRDGRWVAVCNPSRGAVYHDDKLVASFMPADGCRALQIENSGASVTYIGGNGQLARVTFANNMGFSDTTIGAYEGLDNVVYSAEPNKLAYVRRNPETLGLSRVVTNAQNESVEDLPTDALVCYGSTGSTLAYVSGMNINLVRDGQPTVSASLDAEKLSCPREFAVACAYDGDEGWIVICRNGYVEGRGNIPTGRDQYDFTSLMTGAEPFSIQRYADGADIITATKWIHVDQNAAFKVTVLSHELEGMLHFIHRDSETEPLIGIVDGKMTRIDKNGIVAGLNELQQTLAFSGFVENGAKAVQIWNDSENLDERRSYVGVWDIATAKLQNQLVLDQLVQGVNISPLGQHGFYLTGENANKLTWFNWGSLQKIGDVALSNALIDAIWSPNEELVILKDEVGNSKIYGLRANQMVNIAAFDANVDVVFHSDDYVWIFDHEKIDSPRVRLMKLADGLYSVDFDSIENALKNKKVDHIDTNINSKFIVFWGEDGIWAYNTQTNRINQVFRKPVKWLTVSHSGEFVAIDSGILDLNTKDNCRPVYPADSEPVVWSGDDSYVLTWNSDMLYSVDGLAPMSSVPRVADDVEIIGNASGLHPSVLRLIENRDNLSTIVSYAKGNKNIAAAFAGFTPDAWCWMTSGGLAQGTSIMCPALAKYRKDTQTATVANDNSHVVTAAAYLVGGETVEFKPAQLAKFVDTVKLRVTATPAEALVLFGVSDGEKPAELESPDPENVFMSLPFEANLKASDRGFAAVLYLPGYAMRTVPFTANNAEVNLHVMMLKDEYANISVAKHEAPDEVISEDTSIALASFAGDHRDALRKCLKGKKLTVEVNESCSLSLAQDSAKNDCLNKVFAGIEQNVTCKDLPGLAEFAFENFDIMIP